MIIDPTVHVVPGWITLTFTRHQGAERKSELLHSFLLQSSWSILIKFAVLSRLVHWVKILIIINSLLHNVLVCKWHLTLFGKWGIKSHIRCTGLYAANITLIFTLDCPLSTLIIGISPMQGTIMKQMGIQFVYFWLIIEILTHVLFYIILKMDYLVNAEHKHLGITICNFLQFDFE